MADDPLPSLPLFCPPERSDTAWGYALLRRDEGLEQLAQGLLLSGPEAEAAPRLRRAAFQRERPQDLLSLVAEHLVGSRWMSLGRRALAIPSEPGREPAAAQCRATEYLAGGFPIHAQLALSKDAHTLPPAAATALRGAIRADRGHPGAIEDLTRALAEAPADAPGVWRDQVELELVEAGISFGLLEAGERRLEALDSRLLARPRADPGRRRALALARARAHLMRGRVEAAASVLTAIPAQPGAPHESGQDLRAASLALAIAVAQGRRCGVQAWLDHRASWDSLTLTASPGTTETLPRPWRLGAPPGDVADLMAARALARDALGYPRRDRDRDRKRLADLQRTRGLVGRLARELGWIPGVAAPLAHLVRPLPRPRRAPLPVPDSGPLEQAWRELACRPLSRDAAERALACLDLRAVPGGTRDTGTGLPTEARDAAGQAYTLLPESADRGPAYLAQEPWTWARFLAAGGIPAPEQSFVCLRPGPACGLTATQVRRVLPAGYRLPSQRDLAAAPGHRRSITQEDLELPLEAWSARYGPHRGLRWTPDLRILRPLIPVRAAMARALGRPRRRRARRLGPVRVDLRPLGR